MGGLTMLAEWPRVTAHGRDTPAPSPDADWMALLEELCQLSPDRPTAELLATIVDTTVVGLGADACSLGLWDPDRNEIVTSAHADRVRPPEGARFALGEGVAGQVASTRRAVVIGDAARDSRYVSLEYPRTNSVLSVPMIRDDDLVGTLTVTNVRVNAFDEADLRVLRLFATQSASLVLGSRRVASDGGRAAALELAIDAADQGIVVCDQRLKLVAANSVARSELRLRVDSASPELWPAPTDILRSALERAIRDQSRQLVRLPMPTAGDGERTAQVTPLQAPDGRVLGAVAVIRRPRSAGGDVEPASGTTEDLAHDLKSPLNSVRGLMALVLMDEVGQSLTPTQRDLLEHAQMAGERLQATIERLVDPPKWGRDERPALQPTAFTEVVAAVIARLQGMAADRGVTIDNAVGDDVPRVQADPFQLARVLENLVDNATKFTPAGGVVRLEVVPRSDRLQCSVRDTGVGIPSWALERVFERQFQVPGSQTAGGSGLGLAICRRIIEQHGGRIWAESVEGRGTTISFTLPLADQTSGS